MGNYQSEPGGNLINAAARGDIDARNELDRRAHQYDQPVRPTLVRGSSSREFEMPDSFGAVGNIIVGVLFVGLVGYLLYWAVTNILRGNTGVVSLYGGFILVGFGCCLVLIAFVLVWKFFERIRFMGLAVLLLAGWFIYKNVAHHAPIRPNAAPVHTTTAQPRPAHPHKR